VTVAVRDAVAGYARRFHRLVAGRHAVGSPLGAWRRRRGVRCRIRTARIEFTRPHAVVAVTEGEGGWDGLPVFAAWVEQAVPAQ